MCIFIISIFEYSKWNIISSVGRGTKKKSVLPELNTCTCSECVSGVAWMILLWLIMYHKAFMIYPYLI